MSQCTAPKMKWSINSKWLSKNQSKWLRLLLGPRLQVENEKYPWGTRTYYGTDMIRVKTEYKGPCGKTDTGALHSRNNSNISSSPISLTIFSLHLEKWGSAELEGGCPTASYLTWSLQQHRTFKLHKRLWEDCISQWFSNFRGHHKYMKGFFKTQTVGLLNLIQ